MYMYLYMYMLYNVGGESGSADTVRDPRGFAVKFYTEEGNWDLVGNNTPIFFIRDPILVGWYIYLYIGIASTGIWACPGLPYLQTL